MTELKRLRGARQRTRLWSNACRAVQDHPQVGRAARGLPPALRARGAGRSPGCGLAIEAKLDPELAEKFVTFVVAEVVAITKGPIAAQTHRTFTVRRTSAEGARTSKGAASGVRAIGVLGQLPQPR